MGKAEDIVYRMEYNRRPEVQARNRIRDKLPETKERKRLYYQKNKERLNRNNKEYQRTHVEQKRATNRKYELSRKIRIYNHYSNYDIKCNCCGEKHIEFLTLDHINNDGAVHRRLIGLHLHRWVLKNNFPPGFQLLCFNCNWNKHHDVDHICIHQRELAELNLKPEVG